MWSEKLKLSKQLVRSVTDAGFFTPKEMQVKTLSRIIGGQDIIAVGPEGCGKTTSYVLGVLMRLKYGFEEAPRALILVPDKEKVEAVIARFELLNKNPTIRIVGLFPAPGMEAQLDALANGADIVVATPDRARAIYLKLALNLNKIMTFVVDDAETIVKKGLQLPVAELANSIIKCQHLVFTEVVHSKISQMIEPFMNQPAVIEVEEYKQTAAEIHHQILYTVPNYRTKLNLLDLLLGDTDIYEKAAVFVNTRLNAEKVYTSLRLLLKDKVAILNPMVRESKGVNDVGAFIQDDNLTVLVVDNEQKEALDLSGINLFIHFEMPEEKETFIARMIKRDDSDLLHSISFATDLEQVMLKKIEHAIGLKFEVKDLPENLVIVKDQKAKKDTKPAAKPSDQYVPGAAFHEKKASNSKDYNLSASKKAKMNKKKKH